MLTPLVALLRPVPNPRRQFRRRVAPLLRVLVCLVAFVPRAHAQASVPDGFRDSLIIGGMNLPTGIAFLPDGRLFVTEQYTARLRLVVNGAFGATDPVLTVPNVATGCEQGLLGVAIDPAWPAKPYIYLVLDELNTSVLRIVRYTVAGDLDFTGNGALTISGSSARVILRGMRDQACNHNGGTLRFGNDGMLYASFGEDASRCLAQNPTNLAGVILRLDVSNVPAGGGPAPLWASITPSNNPFAAAPDSASRLVWAYGLRNPFRFQVDKADGVLYISDVGESTYEEMDRAAVGGLNFGWPVWEGPLAQSPPCGLNGTATAPITYYDRSSQGGAAIICAGIYRKPTGASNPFPAAYEGNLFYSDYYTGDLRRLTGSGNSWAIAASVPGQPNPNYWATGLWDASDYATAPTSGALWYCSQGGGQIRAIEATTNVYTPPPPTPPQVVQFAAPFPSPATSSVTLKFTLARDADVSLTMYDARGRLVQRVLPAARQGPGLHMPVWDGLDKDGRRAPSGVYFARLVVDTESYEQRVPVVR
jgi:glucose/arabinose dehydrogenase